MSKTKTKEELIRLSWLMELRRQGHRQCEGSLFERDKVCVLGLLSEVAGLSKAEARRRVNRANSFSAIGKIAGLSPQQTEVVWMMNDNLETFADIADEVAGWF